MTSIIKATVADAENLLKVKIDAFTDEVAMYGYGPPNYDSLENIIECMNKQEVSIYKILVDNEIAGGISIHNMGNSHYHVSGAYIHRSFQNMGVGITAFNYLFSKYKAVKRWTLETPYKSYRNHHFYEKLGFVKFGETEPESDGFYLFVYEKTVMA